MSKLFAGAYFALILIGTMVQQRKYGGFAGDWVAVPLRLAYSAIPFALGIWVAR